MEINSSPILSICIPTYNRSKLLVECLDSVLESIKGYEKEIEIVISDNAGTDNTTTVVQDYLSKYDFISYNKNDENVIDENFFIAARLAQGKYLWIFADDDKMEKNAVPAVVDFILKGYNLIILNYSMWDKYFIKKIKDRGFKNNEIILFDNADYLLKTFGIKIQYLSCIVIEKDKLLCLQQYEYQAYHEYGTSFLLSVYSGIKERLNGIFIPVPLVAYRGFNSDLTETSRWYKSFVTGSNMLLEALRTKGYSKSAVKKAKNKVIIEYVARDVLYKKRNDLNLKGILRVIFLNYRNNFLFWSLLLPLFVTPNCIIRLLKK